MRYLVIVTAVLATLLVSSYVDAAPSRQSCAYGRVQGFVGIRSDPEYLVGTIPSRFTSDFRYFSRRYNCKREGISVRRVDLGIYEVKLGGLPNRVAQVTAISQEGVSASVQGLGDGVYRVALRGPLTFDGALARRDVAFSISVY